MLQLHDCLGYIFFSCQNSLLMLWLGLDTINSRLWFLSPQTLLEIVVTAVRWTDDGERGCLTYRSVKVIQLIRHRLLNW